MKKARMTIWRVRYELRKGDYMKIFLIPILMLVMMGTTLKADGIDTPTYYGSANSVHAHFTKDTNGNIVPGVTEHVGPAPLTGHNGGIPSVTKEIVPIDETQSYTLYTFEVPNVVDTEPTKHMRIEIWWDVENSTFEDDRPGLSNLTGYDDHGGVYESEFKETGGMGTLLWKHDQYWDYDITPNPDWESFTVRVNTHLGTILDEVVVTSVSVPEPATLLLLGLSGLMIRKRQRN